MTHPAHMASTVMLEPSPVKFDESLLAQLRMPPGFKVNVFANDMQHVRWMQVAANGDVYVSRPIQVGGAVGRQGAFGTKFDSQGRLWVVDGPNGALAVVDTVNGGALGVMRNAHHEIARVRLAPDWMSGQVDERITDARLPFDVVTLDVSPR